MKKNTKLINLISVFVIGFALTTFLHEFAHAIVAKILHVDPVLFHTYVSYDNTKTPEMHQLYIAVAGPLFSLFQSLIFLKLFQMRKKVDYLTFLYVWLGVMGVVVFLGYIMIGPFVSYGDTGKVYNFLSIPAYVSFPLSALAMACIIYFFRKTTPKIGNLVYWMNIDLKYTRKKAVRLLFIMPLAIGTIINILISLPAPTAISFIFPIVISFTMIPTAIRLKDFIESPMKNGPSGIHLNKNYLPLTGMLVVIIISRILATGMHL